ncbi:hypothetical protein GE061_019439 [Apolygus lucorum]|uniref:Single domain-containing protein n=1 Tax=Apolygus lucorum TaxID=248454 RepID=A0A6A4JE71_APOLU|nr:hypothetical protein GE061_019439 [Apolygus lucorum]
MHAWLILSAIFGAAFGAVFQDSSQKGKSWCTYNGFKIGVNQRAQPPGECEIVRCLGDRTGKKVAFMSGESCGPNVWPLRKGNKEDAKLVKPTPSPDIPFPNCCPITYMFVERGSIYWDPRWDER